MSQLVVSGQKMGGQYNFLADPGAGAVGNVLLGVFIPRRSLITGFWVIPKVAFTFAGIIVPTIAFGLAFENGAIINNLMVPTPSPAFVAPAVAAPFNASPMMGIDLNVAPLQFEQDATQVAMIIGANAITAGELSFVIETTQQDV